MAVNPLDLANDPTQRMEATMKDWFRVTIVVIVVLSFASIAVAGNPDERTSLTFNFGGQFLSGEYQTDLWTNGIPIDARQDDETQSFFVSGILVAPTSDNVSLLLSLSYIKAILEAEETNYFNPYEYKIGGFRVSIGLRFFLSE